MKNSIKKAQSQACLGFAEQKNFRPLAKLKKLSLTLALLLTAVTGAWAQTTYTVAGSNPAMFGTSWDPTNTANDMTKNGDGTYSITYTNVYLDGNVQYKVVKDHSWDEAYPNFDRVISIAEAGTYTLTIHFNPTTHEVYETMPGSDSGEPEVTLNDDKSEASFQMPQYDVTATYTIKRDMTVDVAATIDDRIRIKKDGNDFQAVDATQINPVVTDNLDAENPVTLTVTTDYTLQLQKQSETNADEWTDVTALSVGNFRYKITGAGNYSGICYSEEFELFQGYEITVPAGEYATYYKDEPLRIEDEEADLYTITSVSADKAVISSPSDAMPANTPMLVFNKSQQEKVILLIPCPDPDLTVTVAPEFQGTLEATTIAASTENVTNYALNGKQFVFVKDAIEIGANKAWLSIPTAISNARALTIVFADATGVESVELRTENGEFATATWYDLNGRKLNGMPTKKGVYIMNGKKVVVK